MECLHAPVPQFDRTMLRLCSAVQLGPFASQERTIEQCSPSCSTTASAQQYGSRASAQVACWASHPRYARGDKQCDFAAGAWAKARVSAWER